MNIVLIIPAEHLDKANVLGETMGWGPNNYSIPLSSDGYDPVSHWGLNLANAGDAFVAMLTDASQGQMPQELIDAGYPAEDFGAVMTALIVGLDASFADTLSANALQLVDPGE